MSKKPAIRVACISDTHEQHSKITKKIPKCDLLIHAGDITYSGVIQKVEAFNDWCRELKERGTVSEVVCIAGNHDITAVSNPERWQASLTNVVYLQDSSFEYRGWHIYGSPWTPSFFRQNWVFNADRGTEIKSYWDKIPNCDVLVTHGPPYGVLDVNPQGEHCGCRDLFDAVVRTKPRMHIVGHIHGGHGKHYIDDTLVINASTCTEMYKPNYDPIIVTLQDV